MSTEEKSPEDECAEAENVSRDEALNQVGEGAPQEDPGQQSAQEQGTGAEPGARHGPVRPYGSARKHKARTD